jgi:mRNA interferase MazF
MQRGEIWWASLPKPSGSEPGYRRPILIVQSDAFNRSRIATVIGVVITSNLQLAQAPGNVLLPRRYTNLPKPSVANISQIITLAKDFLNEQIGHLPAHLLDQVENGLKMILGL